MDFLIFALPGGFIGSIVTWFVGRRKQNNGAVSHTKPLHDAVAQMADDLYGGFAPATPFLSTI